MRFDELPNELIVMLSRRCDPFTRDQIRMSNKRIRNVIDKHFRWKPCLESLSLELAPDGEEMSRIRVRTCTVYGRQEEQIRRFINPEERAEVLAESLAKVTSVRRLHLHGIPIDNLLLPVLMKEFEKMGYLSDLVLEECTIGLGKTAMSQLVKNMNLKCIRIIRCTGAYRIVDDNFIRGASEEFVLEGMLAAPVINLNRNIRFHHGNHADDNPDYDVTVEQVDRQIAEANAELEEIEAPHRPQPGDNPRIRFNFRRNRDWRELRQEIMRLHNLRAQIEMRDIVERPQPHAGMHNHFGDLPGMNFGRPERIAPAEALRQLEALRRERFAREEQEAEQMDGNDNAAEADFAPAPADQGQRMQQWQLLGDLRRGGMAQAPGHVEARARHFPMHHAEVQEQRYMYITKRTLNFLLEHSLPRFEIRNLNANVNITLTAVVELIQEAVEKENEIYWNFGSHMLTKIGDLQILSNIPHIVWNPEPTWLHGLVGHGNTFKQFEMRTTDEKTFIFATNVN